MPINELPGSAGSAAGAAAGRALVGEPAGALGLVVPAGRVRLICTALGAWDPAVTREGLWVFTSPRPQPRLDAWMGRMLRDHRGGKVSYEQAEAAFAAAARPELTRGGAVELTDLQRSALAVEFDLADMAAEEDWPYEDPRLHAVSFAVVEP